MKQGNVAYMAKLILKKHLLRTSRANRLRVNRVYTKGGLLGGIEGNPKSYDSLRHGMTKGNDNTGGVRIEKLGVIRDGFSGLLKFIWVHIEPVCTFTLPPLLMARGKMVLTQPEIVAQSEK
jgi:hypothetical protein